MAGIPRLPLKSCARNEMEWTDCRKEVHDTSLKSLTIGVCAPGLSQPCNRTERWSEGAAQTHGHEWTSTVGLKSVEIRPWASVRQASLSLLSETGACADLADRIERCLIPRIVRRSSPPSCSRSGCHATSLLQAGCNAWVNACPCTMIACIACCPQDSARHAGHRLSASRRAGFEMLGAPLPLRPLLQPLDDTVQRWSSFRGPRGPATFLVAVAVSTNAPRGCGGPLGDPPNKRAIRTSDVAFVRLVLECNCH